MTTPIDLDLVELRCKLRDWDCWRRDVSTVQVTRHEDTAIFIVENCHPLWGSGRRCNEPWAVELARPRLTLADIIADPGDGWEVRDCAEDARFLWRRSGDPEVYGMVTVRRQPWTIHDGTRSQSPMGVRVDAYRAVVDLLVKLAEVAP